MIRCLALQNLTTQCCRNTILLRNNISYCRNASILSQHYSTESKSQGSYSKKAKWSAILTGASLICYGIYHSTQNGKCRPFLVRGALAASTSERVFTVEEVSRHKNVTDSGVWVTYEGSVYDVTDFVAQHPGGDKILLAAGGALEPYWALYAVHKTPEVLKILEKYRIGALKFDPNAVKKRDASNPYSGDPERHPALLPVSTTPYNAETPPELLVDSLVTPNELFFVRNHLPVPHVDIQDFSFKVSGLGLRRDLVLSVNDLKSRLKQTTIRSSVMCAGNRRSDMARYKPVKGLPWQGTAISTADWTGVSLKDLLGWAGTSVSELRAMGVKHIQFEGLDTDPTGAHYGASIPIEVAEDLVQDIVIAHQMNGQELPRDHGYPLRAIIPGVVGARQVKWLHRIILSTEESPSFWQQNDYKSFSPSVDFSNIDYSKATAIMEPPILSAICVPKDGQTLSHDDQVSVKGYAWSGGGRGILRVEVSSDGGETWHLADLHPANQGEDSDSPDAKNHKFRKQWAWTLWEVEIPVTPGYTGPVDLICKAVDTSQNSQPESYRGSWNVRGLLANAWHRIRLNVVSSSN